MHISTVIFFGKIDMCLYFLAVEKTKKAEKSIAICRKNKYISEKYIESKYTCHVRRCYVIILGGIKMRYAIYLDESNKKAMSLLMAKSMFRSILEEGVISTEDYKEIIKDIDQKIAKIRK